MATRLDYALPIARQLLLSTGRRLRPSREGLAAGLPDASAGRPFVIVSGTGRSGTSAVARVLHESGISLGTEFDPPSEQNRVGFYEDTEVRSVNARIVGELGLSDVGRSRRWPWRSAVLAVAEQYRSEMRDLSSAAGDGWKDPLFCVTLEAWLQHLTRRPKLVICLRGPEAFLQSVSHIYGLVRRGATERWWAKELRRLLDVVKDYRLEATCVEYDDLVQRPEETVAALSSFVGRPLDPKYVEPDLRHHSYAVPQRHAALYDEVRALGPRERPPVRKRAVPEFLSRRRRSDAPAEAETHAVDSYIQRMRAIDAQVAAAKAVWSRRVGAPRLRLAHYQALGLDRAGVFEETRDASAAFVAALTEAQTELGSLVPPAGFERYHEITRASVDGERLVAQVTLQAVDSGQGIYRSADDVLRVYRLCSSPEAEAKAQEHRSREYERALRASGYRAVGAELGRS